MESINIGGCLRCDGDMQLLGRHKIQLGQTGWLTGNWNNLLSGALEVNIFICSNCGKIEFYNERSDNLPQVKCPTCGCSHDFDYPKCPNCKHSYS